MLLSSLLNVISNSVSSTNEISFTSIVLRWRQKAQYVPLSFSVMFPFKFHPCPLSLRSLSLAPPSPPHNLLSVYFTSTPKLTPLGRVFRLAELNFLVGFFTFFPGRETVPTSFGELNSECSCHNCAKHSNMRLRVPPPRFQLFQLFRGYLCVLSTLTMMSPYSLSSVGPTCSTVHVFMQA